MKKQSDKTINAKKIIFLIIFVIIILLIGMLVKTINNRKQAPKVAINNAFQALKDQDENVANEYLNYDEVISSIDEMLLKNEDIPINKELFEDLEWNIESVEIDGKTATATVEVTNKNFKTIITNWMKEIVNVKSQNKSITEEIALNKLYEVLQQNNEKKNTTKQITLYKAENKWSIEVDNELRNLLFPGIESIATALNQ